MKPRLIAGFFLFFLSKNEKNVHFRTPLAKVFFYFTANFQKTCNFANNNLSLK